MSAMLLALLSSDSVTTVDAALSVSLGFCRLSKILAWFASTAFTREAMAVTARRSSRLVALAVPEKREHHVRKPEQQSNHMQLLPLQPDSQIPTKNNKEKRTRSLEPERTRPRDLDGHDQGN